MVIIRSCLVFAGGERAAHGGLLAGAGADFTADVIAGFSDAGGTSYLSKQRPSWPPASFAKLMSLQASSRPQSSLHSSAVLVRMAVGEMSRPWRLVDSSSGPIDALKALSALS